MYTFDVSSADLMHTSFMFTLAWNLNFLYTKIKSTHPVAVCRVA